MKLRDWSQFLLLGLVWGSSFFWIKIAVQEVGPFTLVAFRLLFGALALLVVVAGRRPGIPQSKRLWAIMAVLGTTNTALPFVLISWGEQFIESAVASILNATVPLFTMMIAHVFLQDERLTPGKGLGLVAGFSGVVLLFGRDLQNGALSENLLGQGAVLAAAFCYAGSSVFARLNLKDVSPILQAFVTVTFADALIWLAVPLVESPLQLPSSALTWLALVWLGTLGSCVAYLIYYSLIQRVGSTRTTLVTYMMPVVGIVLGVLFLNEQLTLNLVAGAALVVAGVWVVNTN